jgi:hypothetical protein
MSDRTKFVVVFFPKILKQLVTGDFKISHTGCLEKLFEGTINYYAEPYKTSIEDQQSSVVRNIIWYDLKYLLPRSYIIRLKSLNEQFIQ